jgi:hypothetical protein
MGRGIIKRGTAYTTGMAGIGDNHSVAFWAGCPGGTPWEVSNYDTKTGFFITENGGGQIGLLRLDPDTKELSYRKEVTGTGYSPSVSYLTFKLNSTSSYYVEGVNSGASPARITYAFNDSWGKTAWLYGEK